MTDFKDLNIIGLTGMSGAGKSAAARVFAENGFLVIDCDKEAKRIIAKPPCSYGVKRAFPQAYDENGEFNKVKMARIVFSNEAELKRYEKIVFPYIVHGIIKNILCQAEKGRRNFLLDAPTLFQSGADDLCGGIIAVVSEKEICAERIMERDKISEEDALLRLDSQPDAGFYEEKASCLIINNGTYEEFLKNINEIIKNPCSINEMFRF